MKHEHAHRRRKLPRAALLVALATVGAAGLGGVALAGSSSPAWSGSFDGFPDAAWASKWGKVKEGSWGFQNLRAIDDPSTPGGGKALQVDYPAKSGPPSCDECKVGGGQFYQDLTTNGQTALRNSPTVDLKYSYKFPVGFDFGKKRAGKMPGLYGGKPGCQSGGDHCSDAWSTRYMWRGGNADAPNGELYFYGPKGSEYGQDLCKGNWKFAADGKWHSIEQLVNVETGQISIWSDGGSAPVCQQKVSMGGTPVSGIFFSTFHGGHTTDWSPSHASSAEFGGFSLSTARQNGVSPAATSSAGAR
ncbi:polysaccharide lyase [Streptomyces sp. NPDC058989]|uniref:polysaccharide lyase n=1 Tax=Streptomyces sp. NPDC058989 TaxID=3346686 RepID=UPI003694E9C1